MVPNEALQFFGSIGQLHVNRFVEPIWDHYPLRETEPWGSVCLFLEGYAFEHQGRSPAYSHTAVDAVLEIKRQCKDLCQREVSDLVWKRFTELVPKKMYTDTPTTTPTMSEALKVNKGSNPLCPPKTSYTRTFGKGAEAQERHYETKGESVVGFAANLACDKKPSTFVTHFVRMLEAGETDRAHEELKRLNGIGPKIASLFLRDAATQYRIAVPTSFRYLLQPIDIWVRRAVRELSDCELRDEEMREWIVAESQGIANAEAVNQGMWYFGTQIAGSEYRLRKVLRSSSIHDAVGLFNEHSQALAKASHRCREILSRYGFAQ